MDTMSIAALSVGMSQQRATQDMGVAVLKMAMEGAAENVGELPGEHLFQQSIQHPAQPRPRPDTCVHQVPAIHGQLGDAAAGVLGGQRLGLFLQGGKFIFSFRSKSAPKGS